MFRGSRGIGCGGTEGPLSLASRHQKLAGAASSGSLCPKDQVRSVIRGTHSRGPGQVGEGGPGGRRTCTVPGTPNVPEARPPQTLDTPAPAAAATPSSSVSASKSRPLIMHLLDRHGIAQVVQRVPGQDDQVCQLPGLDRAQLRLQADPVGAEDRGGPQRVVVRHAAGGDHPQLPVEAEALELAVAADAREAAAEDDVIQEAGVVLEDVLFVYGPGDRTGRSRPPPRALVEGLVGG